MFGLPASTEVNSRIPKEKIYMQLIGHKSRTKERIKAQIEAIYWRNKLADNTISTAKGKYVEEIQVIEIELRQKDLDSIILPAIVKAVHYQVLFVLTYRSHAQICINVGDTFYKSKWMLLSEANIQFIGLDLDDIYENIVHQIANNALKKGIKLTDAVALDIKRRGIMKDIDAIEKKIQKEKQFNRKVELNERKKELLKELEITE